MKNLLTVNLEGINRASVRNTSSGPMEEVINIGKRTSGIHQAIGKKSVQALYRVNLELYKIYPFPALNSETSLLATLDETGEVYLLTPTSETVLLTVSTPGTETFRNVSTLGNIISVHTDQDAYYIKYDPTDSSYTNLRVKDLPIPQLYVMENSDVSSNFDTDTFTTFDEAIADYLERAAKMGNDGFMEGYVICILAYQLYDGSYIRPGLPVVCQIGNMNTHLNNVVGSYAMHQCQFSKLKCGYGYEMAAVGEYLPAWDGIIRNLSLFISYPTSKFIIDSDIDNYWLIAANDYGPPFNTQAKDILQNITSFYKVHDIPYAEMTATIAEAWGYDEQEIIEFYPEVGRLTTLPTKEALPVDFGSHHRLMASDAFLYNRRQHHANITTRFYEGYSPNLFAIFDGDSSTYEDCGLIEQLYEKTGYTPVERGTVDNWRLYAVYHLETTEGIKKAYREFRQLSGGIDVWEHASSPDMIFLNPILAYPDIRAFKVTIYLRDVLNSLYYQVNTYPLKAHPYHNFAYYQNFNDPLEAENRIWPIEIDLSAPGDVVPFSTITADAGLIADWLLDDLNRVQLTGMDNPFLFPSDNSYRVGNHGRRILKTMAMGEAISEGQFGQFPVYVFTEAGVYTLEVGSGDVVYSVVRPLNSDVLSNVYSVVNVGKGVVYATSKGLFLISGSNRVEISKTVEGRLDNPIKAFSDYEGFLNTDVFIELLSFISERTFNETLQNGRIGFDRKNNEIIVSYYDLNPYLSSASDSASWSGSVDDATRDGYSYIFNFDSGEWTKISQQFNQFIDSYPDFLAIVGNSLYNLTEEDTQDRHIILQTRPFTLGTHDFKKILKLNAYGHFVPTVNTFPSVYIYGSQDGYKWALAQGQQVPYAQNHSTITVQRSIGWCKYFIILIVAQVGLDSNVEGMQIEFDTRYKGKLR